MKKKWEREEDAKYVEMTTKPMLSDQGSQIITYYFEHRKFESLCFAACLRCVLLCATVHDVLTKYFSHFVLCRSILSVYYAMYSGWNMKRMDANNLRENWRENEKKN